MRILVKGDHPIFSRPDKIFKDPFLAGEYFNELFEAGYDNIQMKPMDLTEKETKELADEIIAEVLITDDYMFCPVCQKIQGVFTDWKDGAVLKCETCNYIVED